METIKLSYVEWDKKSCDSRRIPTVISIHKYIINEPNPLYGLVNKDTLTIYHTSYINVIISGLKSDPSIQYRFQIPESYVSVYVDRLNQYLQKIKEILF